MFLSDQQIEKLAPNSTAFAAGKKLSLPSKWDSFAHSQRALWGEIRGSGTKPYLTKVDREELAFNCSCPSRQFPCKHAIALLLLGEQLPVSAEPAWVQEWLDKRRQKAVSPPKEEKDYTPAELEKRDREKANRLESRMAKVDAGVLELSRWLEDLVRVGFLDLPNRQLQDFENMAARMVDAQAGGLANWIRSLGQLPFGDPLTWQKEAMDLIGKLNLLAQTWQNYAFLSPEWQHSLKDLVGWAQSPKELETDANAFVVEDEWLVIGQEKENQEDLEIERTWLWGCHSGQTALILQFGNKFSPIARQLIPGSMIAAQLAFFPGVLPLRAVIRTQKGLLEALPSPPKFAADWPSLLSRQAAQLTIHPWLNNQAYLLAQARIIYEKDQWYMADIKGNLLPLIKDFSTVKLMYFLALTGHTPIDLALVIRHQRVLPLGVFQFPQYLIL
ncbi:MAG: SWIM zinc finger family protein [Saprospiraceae bacterium]